MWFHRKSFVFLLLILVFGVLALPAYAQEPTFGLSDADIALITAANSESADSTGFTFEFVVNLNIEAEGEAVSGTINGSGAFDRLGSDPSFALAVDGNFSAEGEEIPIEAEVRVVDGNFYINAVDPSTGESTGWLGDSVENLAATFSEGFASGAGMAGVPDVESLMSDPESAAMIASVLSALENLDPESFISAERAADEAVGGVNTAHFIFDLSISELLQTEAMGQMVGMAMAAQGGADVEVFAIPLEQMEMMMGMVAGMFEDTVIRLEQYIGTDDQLVRRTVFTFDLSLDLSMMGAVGDPVVMQLTFDITLDNYGEDPGIVAPEDAQMGGLSEFTDAAIPAIPEFDSSDGESATIDEGATSDSQAQVDPIAPAANIVLVANIPTQVSFNATPVEMTYVAQGAETINVTAHSLEAAGVLDTTLELFDDDGNSLIYNDDHNSDRSGLANFDSLLRDVELPGAGTYTLRLNTFSSVGEGLVEITVESETAAPEPTAIPDKGSETNPALSQMVAGEVPNGGTYDFEFEGVEGQVISIAVRATDNSLDPVISLSFDGGEIAENDDHGSEDTTLGRYDSLINAFELPESGTYTLEVRGFGGSGGEFELTLNSGEAQDGADLGGDVDVVVESIRPNGSYEYTLEASAGDVYTLSVRALDNGFDPILSLFNAGNNQFLTSNDDHGSTDPVLARFDARITRHIFQQSGTFIVEVTGYRTSAGEFELTVERLATNAPLESGEEEVITGQLTANSIFTHEFDANVGDFVTITVRALSSNNDFDASVALVSPDGVVIADNDDHGTSDVNLSFLDSRINNFIITESGTYTIEVTGFRDSRGAFALIINVKN